VVARAARCGGWSTLGGSRDGGAALCVDRGRAMPSKRDTPRQRWMVRPGGLSILSVEMICLRRLVPRI